jgi:hypothetical protein
MSVTPTDEALIVALDFEGLLVRLMVVPLLIWTPGVHSIERSAQEDTLLVLFNTAISNLVRLRGCLVYSRLNVNPQVLFRNNFAMSRSITGLFQSFQSSSTVLDPAANPTLFRSTLTIIIKVWPKYYTLTLKWLNSSQDVVESDKNEIVRE